MPFDIYGKIHLDGSSIATGLQRGVGRQISAFGNSIKGQLAAAFGTAALINQVKKTVEFASRMTDLSDATGIQIERLQEFDYAAKQNGTTIDALVRATKALAKARAGAIGDPTGKAARAAGRFGFDDAALRGMSDPAAMMMRLSNAVKGAKFDLNSLPSILELIGQKNIEVLPALINGLEESAVNARRFGQVMEEGVARQLDHVGDRVEALKKQLTVGLGPALVKVGELGMEALSGLGIGFQGAKAFFGSLKNSKEIMFGPAFKEASDAARAAMTGEFIKKALEQQGIEDAQKNSAIRALLPGFEDLDSIFAKAGTGSQTKSASRAADPLITDSLARIGGFGGTAENKTVSLQEKMVSHLSSIERNTKDGIL